MDKYTTLLFSAVVLVGCGDPLIGEWEGRTSSFGSTDVEIEIEAKGEGSVTAKEPGYRYKGDLEWEKTEKREYEIEEECSSITSGGLDEACTDEKNTWHCDLEDDKDKLECTLELDDGTFVRSGGSKVKFKFRRKD